MYSRCPFDFLHGLHPDSFEAESAHGNQRAQMGESDPVVFEGEWIEPEISSRESLRCWYRFLLVRLWHHRGIFCWPALMEWTTTFKYSALGTWPDYGT